MNQENPVTLAGLFTRATTERFRDEYLPRVGSIARAMSREELWWRPHDRTNSVGNLLLHLEGNVRQWILSGIGGEPDRRDRASEFAATAETASLTEPGELFEHLQGTVEQAARLIDELEASDLTRRVCIQGYDVTILEAVYHVLEHFGWHAGQVTTIAKSRLGPDHGIAFYDDDDLDERRNPHPAEG